jgi:hypothetical protein
MTSEMGALQVAPERFAHPDGKALPESHKWLH